MARFYLLQLGSIYFTSSGLAGGTPCKIELLGVDGLRSDLIVTASARNNDASPVVETVLAEKRGVELTANLLGSIKSSVFDALNDLIQNALESGETLTLTASGGASPSGFSAEVIALTPSSKDFSGDRIRGASFRFITT